MVAKYRARRVTCPIQQLRFELNSNLSIVEEERVYIILSNVITKEKRNYERNMDIIAGNGNTPEATKCFSKPIPSVTRNILIPSLSPSDMQI